MRRLFEDLPNVRGAAKVVPEDFVVEEIGEVPDQAGPHLLLWVEKRGRDTQQVLEDLGRLLRIPLREIGVAGQKDRHAVTRQWISIPAHFLPQIGEAARSPADPSLPHGDGWKVLAAHLHGSKLRTGRLVGNRFEIRLRGAATDKTIVEEALRRFSIDGLPNYFGSQRFGRRGENASRGRDMLLGRLSEKRRFKARMYLSALQSELFNSWLDRRIEDGLLTEAVPGDLLRERDDLDEWLEERSSSPASVPLTALAAPLPPPPRLSEDASSDTQLIKAGMADVTGPIFGEYMERAEQMAGEREALVLETMGLSLDDFTSLGRDAPGSRRPARAWLRQERVHTDDDDLVMTFVLERGGYATVLLRQLGLCV